MGDTEMMIRHRDRCFASLLVGVVALANGAIAQPQVQWISRAADGVIPPSFLYDPRAIQVRQSPSGPEVLVVGNGQVGTTPATLAWSSQSGMSTLNLGSAAAGTPLAMSRDGGTIVGVLSGAVGSDSSRAVRWGAGGAASPVMLPQVDGTLWSYPRGVNGDGSVIVGVMRFDDGITLTNRAARWTSDGLEFIGPTSAEGMAVSVDGSVVLMLGGSQWGGRWTAESGLLPLPSIANSYGATPSYLSDDASIISGGVSMYPSSGNAEARVFRWSESTGTQLIQDLPGANFMSLTGMSGDGTWLVGQAEVGFYGVSQGFLWSAATGTIDANDYLVALGLDLQGWTIGSVLGLSSDGTSLLVQAGGSNGWGIAVITGITLPSPSAAMLSVCGLIAAHKRRRGFAAR